MESLTLFKNFKERRLFFLIAFFVFIFNLYVEFTKYKQFTKNEVYHTSGTIQNYYQKENHSTVKIKTDNFTFFTPYKQPNNSILYKEIDLYIVSKNITFISYLKGFYTKSFNLNLDISKTSNIENIHNLIVNQHTNNDIASLYSALYLASPLTSTLRELSSKLGISHLIAISGFHLGVISFVLYFLIHILYKRIHSVYFPYRNKRFDIMIFISIILLSYMVFIDTPPSLLRSFFMFVFGFFLVRNNIKLISFDTLLILLLVVIALFPKLLFSLSLWFSVIGVFYIFLFIKYFNNLNKIIQFVIFNFWIYLTINPITHYFFATTALEQLYSPILTILFSIFYPITVILHFLNNGSVFDQFFITILNTTINSIEINTPRWFFVIYIIISLLSITKKEIFILLNLLMIFYNIWLFHFIF